MVNFQVIYVIYVICMVFWDLFAHLFTLQVSTRPKILFVVISCNQPSVFIHPSFLTIFFSFSGKFYSQDIYFKLFILCCKKLFSLAKKIFCQRHFSLDLAA